MNKVIIDDEFRTKLNGLDTQAEFCDRAGDTLGHFAKHGVFLPRTDTC